MYVYVIASSDSGPSKIGIANNPQKRLRGLQTGSPTPLQIFATEPIGFAAAAVERAAHKSLSAHRSVGGGEWFNVTPQEAHAAIRDAASAAGILMDDEMTLSKLDMRNALTWIARCEELADEHEEDEFQPKAPLSPLLLIALSQRAPAIKNFTFNDYLLTWNEGMWLRWAFDRLNKRPPTGRSFNAYLAADDFLETKNAAYGRDVCSRWIEWSRARELEKNEVKSLQEIWDRFVPLHNQIERDGPQWATAGIDDHVDEVHLFALSGNSDLGDRDCVVFRHRDFRAVLKPRKRIELFHRRALVPLNGAITLGFVTPTMPNDIWERPFQPWLRDAAQRRESALAGFLNNPTKRFPSSRPYDGPQQATTVWTYLDCIEEDGTF